MEKIEYFVFFDLETTGLPWNENNKTKITELAMVAVSRTNLLYCPKNEVPRVQHKLVLCFNPKKSITSGSSEKTGLWNFSLDEESSFDENTTNLINAFLKKLKTPICLVAHNGFKFDYIVFNSHLVKSDRPLIDGIVCIDSLPFFKDSLNNDSTEGTPIKVENVGDLTCSPPKMARTEDMNLTPVKKINSFSIMDSSGSSVMLTPENTPVKSKNGASLSSQSTPLSKTKDLPKGFKLESIYHRLMGYAPVDTHRAEGDCIILLESCTVKAKEFVDWCDNNRVPIEDFPCMVIGEKYPSYDNQKKQAVRRIIYQD